MAQQIVEEKTLVCACADNSLSTPETGYIPFPYSFDITYHPLLPIIHQRLRKVLAPRLGEGKGRGKGKRERRDLGVFLNGIFRGKGVGLWVWGFGGKHWCMCGEKGGEGWGLKDGLFRENRVMGMGYC